MQNTPKVDAVMEKVFSSENILRETAEKDVFVATPLRFVRKILNRESKVNELDKLKSLMLQKIFTNRIRTNCFCH